MLPIRNDANTGPNQRLKSRKPTRKLVRKLMSETQIRNGMTNGGRKYTQTNRKSNGTSAPEGALGCIK